MVDQALLIEKSSSQLYYFNALANYRTGNIEKAKHFLDKSKACFPNYSSINTLAKSIELSELEQSDSHHLNIKYKFKGQEVFDDKGNCIIKNNPKFFRPAEVDLLVGDSTKAKEKLLWKPKHTLETLVKDMIEADLKRYKLG